MIDSFLARILIIVAFSMLVSVPLVLLGVPWFPRYLIAFLIGLFGPFVLNKVCGRVGH